MKSEFPENLARLRREKNLNQRTAAEDLGISQALLSHYEKGVREPRFEFVERACAYYGVSADFLLGLKDQRTSLDDVASGLGKGESVHTLIQACREVFSVLSDKDPELCDMAADLLIMELASVMRMMYEPGGADQLRCGAAQKLAEAELSDRLRDPEGFRPLPESVSAIRDTADRFLGDRLRQGRAEE